ncbi:MAG TPA: rRNA pseudouridine synthase [Bacteroidetes bacterium]|nr:rRNA pseudouridine synthase [Bacteroidota bacterium]
MKKYRKKSFISKRDKPIPQKKTTEIPAEGMRLNKYIAHCGICSRRKAAEFIQEGLVQVNGNIVKEMGHRVLANDEVKFKGKVVRPEVNKVYILLNKPKDYITTMSDERGRKTVMDLLKDVVKERIFPVGRLDRATTGLLLLTNDGELAKKLSHPSHNVKKVYHVVLDRPVSPAHIDQINNGITLEDGAVKVDGVSYVKGKAKNEVGIEIHLGRNRIVRRIFEHFNYKVKRLDRVYYGGLTKKDLPRGRHRFLREREIIMLKHFV